MNRKLRGFILPVLLMIIITIFSGVGLAGSDPFNLKPLDPAVSQRIREYRTREVRLIVKDASGQPLKNEDILVEQVSHDFLFGCNIFLLKGGLWYPSGQDPQLEKEYLDRFSALFNYATVPLFWQWYEPRQGTTQENKLHEIAQWCLDHGIRPKGHPLIWHETLPDWLKDQPAEQFEPLLKSRVQNIAGHFVGQVDTFDIINESLAGPRFSNNPVGTWERKLGPVEASRRALTWAREANPKAFLVINDFNSESPYVDEVKSLIKSGSPPDAIGIQAHMHHGDWTPGELWLICERLKKTGLPIHITEMTVLSGAYMSGNDYGNTRTNWETTPEGERRQAQAVYKIYATLFSHPSVQAITWWDMSDTNAWLGAPAGLLRRDMSPKPAYEVLQRLIKKEWWTGPLQLRTDGEGQVVFRGFYGNYRVVVHGKVVNFALAKAGSDSIEVTVGK